MISWAESELRVGRTVDSIVDVGQGAPVRAKPCAA